MDDTRPFVDAQKASELFTKYYGHVNLHVVDICELKAHEDRNFKITTKELPDQSQVEISGSETRHHLDGINLTSFILKVTLTSTDDIPDRKRNLEQQFSVMEYARDNGYRCPIPVVNSYGNCYEIESLKSKGGVTEQMCLIYALPYIEGTPVLDMYKDEGIPTDVLNDLGMLLASWRDTMELYPGNISPVSTWTMNDISDWRQKLRIFKHNEDKVKLVSVILDAFEHNVLSDVAKCSAGIIHGDFHDENVIIVERRYNSYENPITSVKNPTEEESKIPQETDEACSSRDIKNLYGIIDFADMHHAPYVYDLATSVAFFMISAPDPEKTRSNPSEFDSGGYRVEQNIYHTNSDSGFRDCTHTMGKQDFETEDGAQDVGAQDVGAQYVGTQDVATQPGTVETDILTELGVTLEIETELNHGVKKLDIAADSAVRVGSEPEDVAQIPPLKMSTSTKTTSNILKIDPERGSCQVSNREAQLLHGTSDASPKDEYFLVAGREFLEGYLKVQELSDSEWNILYLAVCAAYCRELVVGEYDFIAQKGNNDYLLTSVKNGWRQLEILWHLGEKQVIAVWKTRNKTL